MTLIALPLSRRLEECNMSHGLLPAPYTNTNLQRGESRAKFPDTSIYFTGAIKSTFAALASAPKATKSTSARSDEREKGASFNKSFAAGRETKSALLFR